MKNMASTHQHFCETGFLERPRYFARQLLTPTEMTLEQTYFRDKLRRHNRLLHGWGVVCGAIVCIVPRSDGNGPEPWKVKVTPGYALGPYGDEILIDKAREVDLRTPSTTCATGESHVDQSDPWCTQVWIDRREGPLYVAVKYKEITCRPVRVQPNGCGCDDSQCENSRIRDGYEFGVLDECPEHDPNLPKIEDLIKGPNPQCTECPDSPWVVLAEVQIDADGSITAINNCECRRIMLSTAPYWRACENGIVVIDMPNAVEATQGDTGVTIAIPGQNVDLAAEVSLGPGVRIKSRTTAVPLTLTVDIDETAAPGSRTLTVVNPDGVTGIRRDALKILPKVAPNTAKARPTVNAEKPAQPQADTPKKRTRTGREKEKP